MAQGKILVVDDSATEMLLITSALKGEGYAIVTATTGEEAMQRLGSEQPDLVVLDVVLPGKNGFQLCRQIRNDVRWGTLPVILLTSKDGDADKFWGMKQGASEYMTKPFEAPALLASVRRHI